MAIRMNTAGTESDNDSNFYSNLTFEQALMSARQLADPLSVKNKSNLPIVDDGNELISIHESQQYEEDFELSTRKSAMTKR
jgi:hypothetical protein